MDGADPQAVTARWAFQVPGAASHHKRQAMVGWRAMDNRIRQSQGPQGRFCGRYLAGQPRWRLTHSAEGIDRTLEHQADGRLHVDPRIQTSSLLQATATLPGGAGQKQISEEARHRTCRMHCYSLPPASDGDLHGHSSGCKKNVIKCHLSLFFGIRRSYPATVVIHTVAAPRSADGICSSAPDFRVNSACQTSLPSGPTDGAVITGRQRLPGELWLGRVMPK